MYLTQNLVILCSQGLDADALKSLWEALGRSVSSAAQIAGGSSWLVHWDTEGNAGCLVDVGNGPWPDQNELPGWPLAVGALARAIEGCGDPNLAQTAAAHASWIGLRLCYNDGVQRPDLDDELQWLLGVAADLADLPAAVACFDLEQEALLYLHDLPKVNRQPPPLPTQPQWDGAVPSAASTAVTAAAPKQAEATDPMDQMLATIEAWQPHRETIRRHAIGWMKSASFRLSYYDDVHPPLAVQALLHQEMGRRAGEKVWKKAQVFGIQSPQMWIQYQQLAASGQVIFAHSVIANSAGAGEPDAWVPALLVASSDQSGPSILLAGLIGEVAASLYFEGKKAAPCPKLHALVTDDEFQVFRRRPLPVDETQGVPCTFYDVQLRRSWMPPPEIPFIPLLAMPGPKGAVIQIPWQLITSGVAAMGAMPPGKWAEMANLTRQVEREMLSRPPAGLGFFGWIRRLMMWALLCLFGWGVIIVINERFLKSKAVPPAHSEDDTKAELRWNQPAAVLKSVKLAASDKYEPLRGEGGKGRGFLVRVGQMGILAVTTRHQFEVRNVAPSKLYADGGGEITLDTQTVYRQPESQVQMVTEVSKPADYLEYFAAEFVKEGDRLRLVLGAGDWIEGVVTSKGSSNLKGAPTTVKMQVQTTKNLSGTSGCPIVFAKNGHVVGVMQRADRAEGATIIEFETLSLRLRPIQ